MCQKLARRRRRTVVTASVLSAAAATLTTTAPACANDAWPSTVNARYRLKFQGIEVGKSDIQSEATATGYKMSGTSKLSVLLGAFKVQTSGNATGTLGKTASGSGLRTNVPSPAPKTYAFDWKGGKKSGKIHMAFDGPTANPTAVEPPIEPHPDRVPLKDEHRRNVYDPISAIMMLTRSDGKPCDKKVPVFDGKHRFDIAFSPKRQQPIPPDAKAGNSAAPEMGVVCRVTYTPVAGHKLKAETDSFASNKDIEVLLRRVPGTDLMIPHTVTIPTGWGTATMVAERIEVTSAKIGKVAWNN